MRSATLPVDRLLPAGQNSAHLLAGDLSAADLRTDHVDDVSFATRAAQAYRRPGGWLSRHHSMVVTAELVTGLLLVALGAVGMHTAVHGATEMTLHLWALCGVVGAESVSIAALVVMPRWLLGAQRVRLSRRHATMIGLASNAIAAFVPAGMVVAPLWSGRQYQRRGAPVAVAAWTVFASGFASTTTLALLLAIGAGIAGLLSTTLTAVALIGVVFVSAGFRAIVHRASGREGRDNVSRKGIAAVGGSLSVHASLIGNLRAGWRSGGGVLGAAVVNWLADAAALAAAFVALGVPTPWAGLLFAYCAAQAANTLIPIPGGIGVLEGGLFGGLVLAGAAPHLVIAVIALYRIVGYWLPAVCGLPAYWAARRTLQDTRTSGRSPWPVPRGSDPAAVREPDSREFVEVAGALLLGQR